MEAKHTPGPWVANGGRTILADERLRVGDLSEWTRVATVEMMYNPERASANAALIAAAPELLSALVALFAECTMVARYGGEAYNQPAATAAIEAGRAAIAKAEGR
jgi:hypothetical protein